MRNDLPYTVFDTGTLDWFKGVVNRLLLPELCSSVFHGAGSCRVVKAINNLVFPASACASGFNDNNNKKNCGSLSNLWGSHESEMGSSCE